MKILAQEPGLLGKMVKSAKESVPEAIAKWLERTDAALFSDLKDEVFGGGRRFSPIRLDERTIVTTAGAVTFKRRYYRDESTGRCCHPLDEVIGLSPRCRVIDEMRLAVIKAASQMSYSKAGEWASPMAPISKSTVARIVADTEVEAKMRPIAKGGKPHVQIDEKYIKMDGKAHKTRYVTATVFDGVSSHGKRNRLDHRVLISGVELGDVAGRINSALREAYGLKEGDSVFLSGDLAAYIRSFGERLDFGSEYAPDKWHIAHFLSTDERPVAASGVIKRLEEIERDGDVTGLSDDAIKVYKLWEKNKNFFAAWSDPEYKGCCQEAMNSHYYAARFGKFGGSFKEETVKKLSLVIEAGLNGWDLTLSSSALKPTSASSLGSLGKPYEDRVRYDIDTSEMSYGMRKLFSQIEYGVL